MSNVVIIPIILIILVGAWLFSSKKGGIIKIWKRMNTYWLLAGYIVLLIISLSLYLWMPISGELHTLSQKERLQEINIRDHFHDVMINPKRMDLHNQYLKEKIDVAYNEDKLSIVVQNVDATIPILVERKDSDERTLSAYLYETKVLIDNIDISKQMEPVRFDLSGDLLTIQFPTLTTYTFAEFTNEFTIAQFTNKSFFHRDIHFAEQLIYIQIPRDIEILPDENTLDLIYVNEI